MLPTFVIGLREGVEAALIVGIVAAFLVKQGRRDALRWMWLGVALALAISLAVGIALEVLSRSLPYGEQEALETIVGLIAVGFVTFMIVWMRRNARHLRGHLEGSARNALLSGSWIALVAMAFFAVVREGFETAVFLLAAFDASTDPILAGGGALLGIAVAVVIGFGIYTGGVHLNLAKFFKVTGAFLVLIAAGLLATSVHTGHEAGWWNLGVEQAFDLTWLVDPGSVHAALLTGMLGLQPRPTQGETVVYLLYAIPMLIYVLTPQGWSRRLRSRSSVSTAEPAS